MYLKELLEERLEEKEKLIQKMMDDAALKKAWRTMVTAVINTYKLSDGKVFLCGNGGSAADAQHIAAELTGRFYKDRSPLYAEALHVNTSYLTAVANDYTFDHIYERAVDAFCSSDDILIALSTSGNSENVIRAAKAAQKKGAKVIAFTGLHGGKLAEHSDIVLKVPSRDTARIQEMHIFLGHTLCEAIETDLFPS